MEEETKKLLGTLKGGVIIPAPFKMSAQCNRVAVEDGHTESVSLKFKNKAEADEILEAWAEFRSLPQERSLPSAPAIPVQDVDSKDRPQPRLHVDSVNRITTTGRR